MKKKQNKAGKKRFWVIGEVKMNFDLKEKYGHNEADLKWTIKVIHPKHVETKFYMIQKVWAQNQKMKIKNK